ncbi:hypothetical protein KG112_16600 [Nocardioides sp. zg-ZUI104]|uniref:hypothetical protein n=1 Tax=Nocardioides faecalis TaxID=2803858 RepID=UPI001BD1B999|nr:hypothetical protein [Nocardioides faecalis]MBS4754429.1 hypothetical protein [Nocardioides faecalis]
MTAKAVSENATEAVVAARFRVAGGRTTSAAGAAPVSYKAERFTVRLTLRRVAEQWRIDEFLYLEEQ